MGCYLSTLREATASSVRIIEALQLVPAEGVLLVNDPARITFNYNLQMKALIPDR